MIVLPSSSPAPDLIGSTPIILLTKSDHTTSSASSPSMPTPCRLSIQSPIGILALRREPIEYIPASYRANGIRSTVGSLGWACGHHGSPKFTLTDGAFRSSVQGLVHALVLAAPCLFWKIQNLSDTAPKPIPSATRYTRLLVEVYHATARREFELP